MEIRFERAGKPTSYEEWRKLLPDGKYYTSKQLSIRALIKPVTARRWLQSGVGKGILQMRESGIVKRFKVKQNVKSSKPRNKETPEGNRSEESENVRRTSSDISGGIRSDKGQTAKKGRSLPRESSTVSSETKRKRKSWSRDSKSAGDKSVRDRNV